MFAHSYMWPHHPLQCFDSSLHNLLQIPPGQPCLNLQKFGCSFSPSASEPSSSFLAGWKPMGGCWVLGVFSVPVAPAGLSVLGELVGVGVGK